MRGFRAARGRRVPAATPVRLHFALLAGLALAACAREEHDGTLRNVLVLTLDTTRADHLAGFGAADGLTPALARLAAEGVRFTDVTSAAPTTLAVDLGSTSMARA